MINNQLFFCQGKSYFYVLKNNAVLAVATGGSHWVELLPDHVYCLIPSFDIHKGIVKIYDVMPDFLKDFLYCMEIKQVKSQ